MKIKRYYIHGDAYELVQRKYFCALCDAFEFEHHFYSDEYHLLNNVEKYTGSLRKIKKANKDFWARNLRPSNSINLFSNKSI